MQPTPKQQSPKSKLIFVATGHYEEINSAYRFIPEDTILFTGNDIVSFDGSSGQIIFTDALVSSKIQELPYAWISCYLGNDLLFTAIVTSSIMSILINDLVLNNEAGNFYFHDGYPFDPVPYPMFSIPLRAKNQEKRAAGWIKFIEHLKIDGKYK